MWHCLVIVGTYVCDKNDNHAPVFGLVVRKCRMNNTTLIAIMSMADIGDFTAALYIEQYGHCELPHTSHILSRYVGYESTIVSLNRSVR